MLHDGQILNFMKKFHIQSNDKVYVPDPLLLHLLLHDYKTIDRIKKKQKHQFEKQIQFYCLIIDDHWSLFMLLDDVLYHLNSLITVHNSIGLEVLQLGIYTFYQYNIYNLTINI